MIINQFEMAKFDAARISTEVAPPQFVSVAKRPLTNMLATIFEEENDFGGVDVFESLSSTSICASPTLHLSRVHIDKTFLLRSS
ncbi:hypothetical protein Ddye_026342 [Dipteronia dyeriana]|uniref:Uncharacterized protein n=1 Tax=Dipteronia dyeriana TaxID=168575 RepID=A0AAD9TMK2_9ROSI|nr:hypothetical protein Ddye_026342 [Dipteronia dyeriana]